MTAQQLRKRFILFFQKLDHQEIPNVSLIPENDPRALFISAGMHPLVSYLLGEPHPLGKRLVNCQRCLRTDDLEKVGNTSHHTFFEMLGNWSLGDYFKKEMAPWALEFLTGELGFEKKRLSVTIFEGDANAPYDQESEAIWLKLGIPKKRIFPLGKKENWWGPVGETGPCGPDSEIFYDTGKPACSQDCRPGCDCGKYFELWNLVFMEYEKTAEGKCKPLSQKNVDTGMGVERTTAVLQGKDDVYQTELFDDLRREITSHIKLKITKVREKRIRIFLDHSRATVFLLAEEIIPGNKDREYILRRLIRRADDQLTLLNLDNQDIWIRAVNFYCRNYSSQYKELKGDKKIKEVLLLEVNKYNQLIAKAERKIITKRISGKEAFKLFSTYGLSKDQLKERGYQFNQKEFDEEMKKHQKISRASLKRKFTGGLAERSEKTIKLHTATHLLHQVLRDVLGKHVRQIGSNITSERLRFDFTHPEKLTDEQIKEVGKIVNQKIKENLPVKMEVMMPEEAEKIGALAFFKERYGKKVKVYFIGNYSKEVCAGPHVSSTGEVGNVKIVKEESAGAGKRRIYGVIA